MAGSDSQDADRSLTPDWVACEERLRSVETRYQFLLSHFSAFSSAQGFAGFRAVIELPAAESIDDAIDLAMVMPARRDMEALRASIYALERTDAEVGESHEADEAPSAVRQGVSLTSPQSKALVYLKQHHPLTPDLTGKVLFKGAVVCDLTDLDVLVTAGLVQRVLNAAGVEGWVVTSAGRAWVPPLR